MNTQEGHRISAEEVLALWTAYHDSGDRRMRDRLVLTFAPMVKYIVYKKIREIPARCEVEDFISCGLEALIRSIDRYDPAKGATLEQFAWTRIHGAVLDELRRHDWAPRSAWRTTSTARTLIPPCSQSSTMEAVSSSRRSTRPRSRTTRPSKPTLCAASARQRGPGTSTAAAAEITVVASSHRSVITTLAWCPITVRSRPAVDRGRSLLAFREAASPDMIPTYHHLSW